ncbi:MAG: chemotaxis family two-component system response regulator Rcp1 [Polyangiales bacterium]
MTERAVEILLVEDNPGDVVLTKKAFSSSRLLNRLHGVNDGEAALQFLRRQPPYEDAVRPDLVLLDINLPKVSGAEVLHSLKADPELLAIPVVMLTSSTQESDVRRSYDDHVNSCITKPPTFDALTDIIKSLESYWFVVVKRPARKAGR